MSEGVEDSQQFQLIRVEIVLPRRNCGDLIQVNRVAGNPTGGVKSVSSGAADAGAACTPGLQTV